MPYQNLRGSRQEWGRPRNTYYSLRGGRSGVAPPVPSTRAPPSGSILESISVAELVKEAEKQYEPAQIKNCHAIASYNWLERPGASILSPGMPPRWTPVRKPRRLERDSGTYYRDRNAAQYPQHPIEPAVEAIMRLRPQTGKEVQANSIDVVACSSTLGNLLRFARRDSKSSQMLVKVVGRTVHLIRRENSPREIIPDVQGYGHTFPEANTTWDSVVRGSSSHQRILRYQFGGLDCLVRFEADGYLADKVGNLETADIAEGLAELETVSASLESLATSFAGNTVSTPLQGSQPALEVSTGGKGVPQCALFDLKTRSVYRKPNEEDTIASEMPRLWLAQLPNFILAYHSSGTFDDVEVKDMRGALTDWEADKQEELRLFAALLRRIVHIARQRQGELLEITRDEGENFLRIREQMPDAPSALSESTEKRWKAWLDGEMGSGDDSVQSDVVGVDIYSSEDTKKEQGSLLADDVDDWDGRERDYTACDDECGYCGSCKY